MFSFGFDDIRWYLQNKGDDKPVQMYDIYVCMYMRMVDEVSYVEYSYIVDKQMANSWRVPQICIISLQQYGFISITLTGDHILDHRFSLSEILPSVIAMSLIYLTDQYLYR